jgi:hypothetical protein
MWKKLRGSSAYDLFKETQAGHVHQIPSYRYNPTFSGFCHLAVF